MVWNTFASTLMFFMPLTSSPEIMISGSSFVDGKLQGEPKLVRTERQVLKQTGDEGLDNKPYLYVLEEYLPGGLKSWRYVYHPSGGLSFCEHFEYDVHGRLSKIISLDKQGAELEVKNIFKTDSQTEETVTLSPKGVELERTVTKRDELARVLESTSINQSDSTQIHLVLRRDAEGRTVGGRVTFSSKEEVTLRIEIAEQGNQMIMKTYQPDGKLLTQAEFTGASSDEDLTKQILTKTSDRQEQTIEGIKSKDAQGNWTKKMVSEKDPVTQQDTPVTMFYRTVTYY